MTSTLAIPLELLQQYLIVVVRVAAIIMSIPVFGSSNIPILIKAGLALAVSFVILPLVSVPLDAFAGNVPTLALGLAAEVMLGVAISLFVRTLFAGIQLAGQLAGYQMGLAIANVLDPDSSAQIPLLSQMYQIFAMLIFVTVNAHYWFLGALVDSFRIVPPFGFHLNGTLIEQLVGLGGDIFVIGLKVGAPVITILLLTSVSFGLIARTVPQMNVFIVAIPLKIGVGFLFIVFSLPYMAALFQKIFGDLGESLAALLAAMI